LDDKGKGELIKFYTEHNTSYHDELGEFIDEIHDLTKEYTAYIWMTKHKGKYTIYGHTLLKGGELISRGYCRDINAARVVNYCTEEVLR
jgi:hypothetical protein